ncbi:acetate--CoA ligase family protein [Chelativorans sp. Marseille-P2723]|uniref:acetate--CoA ligase family protein n=1 Tax=Chelativorans sp. Marseille-P2723 TaxID=2709133 RepID=UPI00156E9919|nr:acetate--CoA ligase family protein [Chelativorans sp. Marseille-P2723]
MDRLDLRRFFAPKSVALVGASSDLGKFGGRCFRQLRDFGYGGNIYPVNPRLNELDGLACYPDIRSLPETPDHVCIIVPSAAIPETIRQCGERGVPFATIFSSGFAEGGGEDGKKLQAEIVHLARQNGLRFMGPNCNGLINYVDGVALTSTATINGPRAPAGDVAVLGHSGGLAQVNVMWRAQQAGLGISYQVSCGNDADLDIMDYAEFMVDDAHTRVILMLAESIRSGAKLRRLAEKARKAGKPIVMMKLGRSDAGRQAAISHTGALAGSDAVADDVLRQLGIIRVNDCHEMVDMAMVLRTGHRFSGGGLAAVSISGGNLVHLADQGPAQGLSFPAFSEQTQSRLSSLIPNYVKAANPADVTSAAIGAPEIFSGVMQAIAADPSIDVVVPVLTLHSRQIIEAAAEAITGCGKPFAMVWSGGCTDDPNLTPAELVRRGIPVFRDIAPAMQAIRHAVDYAGLAAEPSHNGSVLGGKSHHLRAALAELPARPTEVQAKLLLTEAGLPVPKGELVATAECASVAFDRIGGPVAVKMVSPDASHKTELGGVRLGITSGHAAAEAARAIEAQVREKAPDLHIEGFLVERMAAPGVEMIVGLSHDAAFGPIITVGLGGVQAEMLKDVAHRMLPITEGDAYSMLRQLRGWPLLDGFRGAPAADVEALVRLMMQVSEFGLELAEDIGALDLNPVLVASKGQGVAVCDALLIRP